MLTYASRTGATSSAGQTSGSRPDPAGIPSPALLWRPEERWPTGDGRGDGTAGIEDGEHEQILERVAAVDMAKASGMACTRLPACCRTSVSRASNASGHNELLSSSSVQPGGGLTG